MKILDKKIFTRFEFVRLCRVVVLHLALLSVLNFVSGDNYSGGLFAFGGVWFAAMPSVWRWLSQAQVDVYGNK